MSRLYIIKVGELTLKQGNRRFFELKLFNNIKSKLKGYHSRISGRLGRYILNAGKAPPEVVHRVLSTTFGITSFSPVLTPEKDVEKILQAAEKTAQSMAESRKVSDFRVTARRSDKSFPFSSYDLSCLAGDRIRNTCPGSSVNLSHPSWTVYIEVRDKALVYGSGKMGGGGLPVGCAGRGMLLLSGGIDSPVAGFRMAKRGLKLEAVYFDAYPYTSIEAKEKVTTLAGILSPWFQGLVLHGINFKNVQDRIREKAPEEERTLHLRACMMRCASILAQQRNASCLVTGEALSQVASQTVESIHFTGSVVPIPVFRPLIGSDKEEIIHQAKKIGTYDVSILPYDDCCSIFAPAHPLIRPEYERIRRAHEALDMDECIEKAATQAERIYCGLAEELS